MTDELFEMSEEDRKDLRLALLRMEGEGGERVSLDEVLALFGYTREYLRSLPAYNEK